MYYLLFLLVGTRGNRRVLFSKCLQLQLRWQQPISTSLSNFLSQDTFSRSSPIQRPICWQWSGLQFWVDKEQKHVYSWLLWHWGYCRHGAASLESRHTGRTVSLTFSATRLPSSDVHTSISSLVTYFYLLLQCL